MIHVVLPKFGPVLVDDTLVQVELSPARGECTAIKMLLL